MNTEDLYTYLIEILRHINYQHHFILKGGVLLRNLLPIYVPQCELIRSTVDLDLHYLGVDPGMVRLASIINFALDDVNSQFGLDPKHRLSIYSMKEYKENFTAQFNIHIGKQYAFSIDIRVNSPIDYAPYFIEEMNVYGSTIYQILCDKICAISTPSIHYRGKDALDLYILSYIQDCRLLEIWNLIIGENHVLGSFTEFSLQDSTTKTSVEICKCYGLQFTLEEIYDRVYTFVEPFIKGVHEDLYWNGEQWL